MNKIGLTDRSSTIFALIDIQERLMPVMSDKETLIKNSNILIEGSKILDIPLLVTEQYPKGLGHTDEAIELPEGQEVLEKICFSCVGAENFTAKLKELGAKSLVIWGIETHICVLKTALDALTEGYEVHVVADAVSSRAPHNKDYALERMRQAGAFITTTESILFQMLDEAGNDTFKQISRLIK